MILFKFKHREAETLVGVAPLFNGSCQAFRWTFQLGLFYMGFIYQYKRDDVWHDNHLLNYLVSVTKHFHLGIDHVYYDGPHCSFSLGWVHFLWSGGIRTHWCEKCCDDA
jgi:hypothetical protein